MRKNSLRAFRRDRDTFRTLLGQPNPSRNSGFWPFVPVSRCPASPAAVVGASLQPDRRRRWKSPYENVTRLPADRRGNRRADEPNGTLRTRPPGRARVAGGGVGEAKHFHSHLPDAGAPGGGGRILAKRTQRRKGHTSMMCSRHSGHATACRNEAILRFARLVLVPWSRSARARALASLARDTAHGGSRRPALRWREASQTDGRSPRFGDSKVPPEQRLEAVCPGFLVQGLGTVGQPVGRIRLASRRRLKGPASHLLRELLHPSSGAVRPRRSDSVPAPSVHARPDSAPLR